MNKEKLHFNYLYYRKLLDPYFYMGTKEYEKFVVISRSRTGSNLLKSLLDSHPNVAMGGEIFKNLYAKKTEDIWERFFCKREDDIQQVGFKLFYYHPIDSKEKKIWKILKDNLNIKIIHLVRRNILNTVISANIARKTQTWSNKTSKKKVNLDQKKISIEPKKCLQELERTSNWENEIDKKFSNHSFLKISYEDLSSERKETMNEIFDFLDLADFEVKTSYRKQNKESKKNLVVNYENLVEEISNTKWFYLLNNDK